MSGPYSPYGQLMTTQQPQRQQMPETPTLQPLTTGSVGKPCWALLAALCVTPFSLVGYALEVYSRYQPCRAGALCNLDVLAGALQVLIIWGIFAGLWVLIGAIGERSTAWGPTLQRLAQMGPTRTLLGYFGSFALIGLFATIVLGRFSPTLLAMAFIVIVVAIQAIVWRPAPPSLRRVTTRRTGPVEV